MKPVFVCQIAKQEGITACKRQGQRVGVKTGVSGSGFGLFEGDIERVEPSREATRRVRDLQVVGLVAGKVWRQQGMSAWVVRV